ncbi:unnamed protein product [Diabrotica balteata]|uniref:THAP-type domain-containing protein n=1 Tax=Diabrotica balteata TaxID=107213 RepID=A0A9N9X6L2_DIABA|nr:unnamed protein product [Diabrotica balteata]
MASCAFVLCPNNSRNNKKNSTGISFHGFPKDVERRNGWIQFVNSVGTRNHQNIANCVPNIFRRTV